MRIVLILCSILFSIQALANNEQVWNDANNFFQQKEYEKAVSLYTQIAEQEPNNANVYFNLGNAQYRLNNIGAAILNYEKALKIEPGNSLINDNLYLAQGRINNRIQPIKSIFFIKWWNSITHSSNSNTYAIFSIILFILAITYIIGERLGYISFNIPTQAKVGVFVLAGIFIIISIVSGMKQTNSYEAIVMQNDASLLNSPKSNKSQSLIPEGTKVSIRTEQENWLEIQLPDGRTGWMQANLLSKI